MSQAKQAKIVKLNRLQPEAKESHQLTIKEEAVEFKQYKNYSCTTSTQFISHCNISFNKSFETNTSNSCSDMDESDYDVSGEYLSKLYIIKDFNCELLYGDLSVKKGQHVYLICESDTHCYVENECGIQGFIPKDVCIDLEETVKNARIRMHQTYKKVTSL